MKEFLIKFGTSVKEFFIKFWTAVKEFLRKTMVTLKRRPHLIALIMSMVSFVVYSFKLTDVSNTTAYLGQDFMGLCQFAVMLFSALSLVCLLGAFPRRQRPKVLMIVLYFAMCAVIIFCDVVYYTRIQDQIGGVNPPVTLKPDGSQDYVLRAESLMITHIVLVGISVLLTATVKLYGKLFQLVNTNVELEYTEATEKIEIEEE